MIKIISYIIRQLPFSTVYEIILLVMYFIKSINQRIKSFRLQISLKHFFLFLLLILFLQAGISYSKENDKLTFSIVILPDTEYYTSKFPGIYYQQVEWIINNQAEKNIKFVVHLGDITESNTKDEWEVAVKAHERLKAANIPYSLVPGDHDYPDYGKTTRNATNFTTYFPPESLPWYTWDDPDYTYYQRGNSFCLLEPPGHKFLILNLEFLPVKDTLSWAHTIRSKYPRHKAIVISHGDVGEEMKGITPEESGNSGVDNNVIRDYYNNSELSYFYGSSEYDSQGNLHRELSYLLKLSGHGGEAGKKTTKYSHRKMKHELFIHYQTESFHGIPGLGNFMQNGNGWLLVMTINPNKWKYSYFMQKTGITVQPYSAFQGGIGELIDSREIKIYTQEPDIDSTAPYSFPSGPNTNLHDTENDPGWVIEPYRIRRYTYFFLLHEKTGKVRIYSININGSLNREIANYNLGPGWSSALPFTVNTKQFLFISNKSRGNNAIYKINGNGTLGSKVAIHSWNPDWNNPRFFYIKDDTYLFFLMEEYSNAAIFRMNPDGTIGTKIDTYKWFPKFTHVRFYKVRGIMYMLLLEANTGKIYIYDITPWGKIGNRISERDAEPGWNWVEMYNIAGKNYLYLLHKSGRHYVYRIDHDGLDNGRIIYDWNKPVILANGSVRINWGTAGDVGARVAGYIWNPDWSYAKHYTVGSDYYMLFYHSGDNKLKIHPLITAGYTRYLNSDGAADFDGKPQSYEF